MSARIFRRFATLAATMLGLALVIGPATAQFGPGGPMRVGFILPPEPAADAPAWKKAFVDQITHGAIYSTEIMTFNADLLELDFDVLYEAAEGPDGVVAAADRLLEQGVFGIIGGTTVEEALALSQWSAEHGIPYINNAVQSDLLRNDMCAATTFDVEASAGMYIDALAGWYVRDGFRSWFIVHDGTDEGERLYNRLEWALQNRHFGASEVGNAVVREDTDIAGVLAAYNRSRADLIVLLVSPEEQVRLYGALNDAGFTGEVAGYPFAATQTRIYFRALAEVAPDIDLFRAELWEPTLDTSGAIEFNLAYSNRWDGETMDGPAWSAFHAIKVLYDAASFGGSADPADVVDYLASQASVFDLHKLIGASFRPWDHQLRQPLYLVSLDPAVDSNAEMGLLVGELPALYLPGTDPVERLDQIGDLANRSTCRF